uniref:Sushi domain-containing protein n=1 Tax=Takifugu rubripes TaxID=31033 RepID=A0A3B5KET7_TAKRU
MNTIGRIGVLILWMHTLTLVRSKDCQRESFLRSRLYDSNFDISTLESTYANRREVRVPCNIGHSGFFKLVCNDGEWTSKGKPCRPISCGHPGDAQFAEFQLVEGEDFVFGSKVVYTCHKGYQMVSRINYRRCFVEGWDGVVPVCEAQQCPFIRVDNNVFVNGDPEEATFGNVIRFSCKSKLDILEGPSEIYCNEEGEWSGRAPKCKKLMCLVPEIENGYITEEAREYSENEILYFSCNEKFKRREDRPSKCTKVGMRAEWSPTPECEPTKCVLQLPPLKGTTYEPAFKSVFVPGETLRVTCEGRFWIFSSRETVAETTCNDDGQWTINPVCKEVVCTNEREYNVRRWDVWWGQRIVMGATVEYSCIADYESSDGSNLAKCTREGWKPKPLCQEITCNRKYYSYAVIEGTDKSVYKYNEQVDYVCNNGYVGRFTLTCGKGRWKGTQSCMRKPCNRPELMDANIRGDKLTYTCDEGYKLFNKGWWGEATCVNHLWSGLEQCIGEMQCGEIPAIANGEALTIQKPYDENESTEIRCNEGFEAQVTRLSCHEGEWSSDGSQLNTICTARASNCDAPPKVDNAIITTTYKNNYLTDSEVVYECRNKYMLVGEGSLRCLGRKWEEKNITCALYCDLPKDHTITFKVHKDRFVDGEVLQYQCSENGEYLNATCVDGKWDKTVECDVKPCVLPEETANGYYELIKGEEFVFGSIIQYFCNEGYQMVSRVDTRTCMFDKWTNHVPVCEPSKCNLPPEDGQVVVKGLPENNQAILPDRFLRFSCEVPGKYLNGSSLLVCGKDGQWDKPFPTCEDITCDAEEMHNFLRAWGLPRENGKMKIGHKLQFECVNGFALDGRGELTCLENGKWDAPFPTCSENCRITDVPWSVGIISGHRRYSQVRKGQIVKFSCKGPATFLHGTSEVECLDNGQWSQPFPTCGGPLKCGRPPGLENGDLREILQYEYQHGARVEYACQNLYVLAGSPYTTCHNGKWVGSMRCLKPCVVTAADMRRRNIDFRDKRGQERMYAAHNDRITFRCTYGTPGWAVNMGRYCNDGVMVLPTCS